MRRSTLALILGWIAVPRMTELHDPGDAPEFNDADREQLRMSLALQDVFERIGRGEITPEQARALYGENLEGVSRPSTLPGIEQPKSVTE